jgi:hypothetical protein
MSPVGLVEKYIKSKSLLEKYADMTDYIARLKSLSFTIVNDAPDVLVCTIEPIGPDPDDGRWLDLSLNEERCLALQEIGTIVNVAVRGITGQTVRRDDQKPQLFIEVRKRRR